MTTEPALDIALAMASHEGTSRAWKHQIEEAATDRAVVTMKVLPDMVNGLGVIHGGLTFALADTALAYLACAANELHVTSSAAINFLSPGKLGETLTATATVAAREGRSTAVNVLITGEDGRTIATCHGVSRKLGGSVTDALKLS